MSISTLPTFKLPPEQPFRFVCYDSIDTKSVRLGTVMAQTEEQAYFKVQLYFEGGDFHPQGKHHSNPIRVCPAHGELIIP